MAEKNNPHKLRIPPQDIDAEKALLGSVMLKADALFEIMDFISVECFYAEKHRLVFKAMLELFSKKEPIDVLTLSNKLKNKQVFDQIGGSDYLTELVNTVPSSANIEYYAKIVHKKYMLRRLIESSERISELGYNEVDDLDESLDKAEKSIYEVTTSLLSNKFIEIKDALGEAFERLSRLHESTDKMRGVPSGFKSLDNKLSGFQKSDLIILAARPSMGKTAFALDIARRVAIEHKKPVAIFSLEMSSQQLVDRMLAADSKVDAWKLRTGKLNKEEEFDLIRESLNNLSKAPIFIDDQPANNILKMRSMARKLKRQHGLELIIVDYLQLMAPTQTKSSDNVVQQVTEISRSLKHLARELDVPVIALSQLSRAIESRGGRPKLSDLRDSGSIEQDADVVMFIHRDKNDDGEKSNVTEILIEKHRNGPTGRITLNFDDKKATFQEIDTNAFDDFALTEVGDDDAF
ncbi:TPA: replicative DNA helicase [Candidatus Campbellbacteria bacterium]|nr:MAG: replicative DNA helicase, replicative DNA helicase [Candidatus Campbellbacteria bacterium GW2011_OD1_34_28]KKP74950.1 MAG: Replicative DNA helicase [Candidatus Campbellbacteria bacterium GW2011_GWD2_35_24]KKP75836.1 MAG: replicative DNA helicase [Candidatus Campbellbacteria bacterium GW2011_GWC2_35_28]KKP76916.1 MAG: Replicative DNA helicase [Candidatus Campbellbacteria bacterium GW2011_GWC1_35_31]KKP78842.1 MAG: Replicative DNA helicase [Candidatus Campbellbacteria bacterium GW2011_GWD